MGLRQEWKQEEKRLLQYFFFFFLVRNSIGLDQSSSRGGEDWFIVRVEPTGFPCVLDVEYERRRYQGNCQGF